MSEEIIDRLKKAFFDPQSGLTSVQKFQKANPDIPKKIVKDFVEDQAVNQITKRKKKKFFKIFSNQANQNVQIDLADFSNNKLNDFKYALFCLDTFSRFLTVFTLKNKKTDTVLDAFKKFVDIYKGTRFAVQTISADNGSEFINKKFKDYLDKNDITLYLSRVNNKGLTAMVERSIGTIRGLIKSYQVAFDTKAFDNVFQDLVANYNHSYHSSIKTTPSKKFDEYISNETREDVVSDDVQNIKFEIGDKVRKEVHRKIFDKTPSRFSKTVHEITKIEDDTIVPRIYLDNDDTEFFLPTEIVKAKTGELDQESKNELTNENKKIKSLNKAREVKKTLEIPETTTLLEERKNQPKRSRKKTVKLDL